MSDAQTPAAAVRCLFCSSTEKPGLWGSNETLQPEGILRAQSSGSDPRAAVGNTAAEIRAVSGSIGANTVLEVRGTVRKGNSHERKVGCSGKR